jgi:hypothetical protein
LEEDLFSGSQAPAWEPNFLGKALPCQKAGKPQGNLPFAKQELGNKGAFPSRSLGTRKKNITGLSANWPKG